MCDVSLYTKLITNMMFMMALQLCLPGLQQRTREGAGRDNACCQATTGRDPSAAGPRGDDWQRHGARNGAAADAQRRGRAGHVHECRVSLLHPRHPRAVGGAEVCGAGYASPGTIAGKYPDLLGRLGNRWDWLLLHMGSSGHVFPAYVCRWESFSISPCDF